MPAKKSVPAHSGAPSKSGRQRTLTNKQQQLRKTYYYVFLLHLIPFFFCLIVAQKNEKEGAAKQRALTDAIRSEHVTHFFF